MNKQDAKKFVEEEKPTVGELAIMVRTTSTEGQSIVNPQFSKQRVLQMMMNCFQEQSSEEVIDRTHKDFMTAVNIVRECA